MDGVSTYLFTQGILGVVVVALLYDRSKLTSKIDKQQARIEELQDLRLQDSKDVTKDVTAVLQGNAQSNLILAEKIEVAKGNRRNV